MSRESRIDDYIGNAQLFAQPILLKVRERVHAVVPDVEETMKWGMPAYTVGGKILLITAAFKAHAALNFWRGQERRDDSSNHESLEQFGKIKSIHELPADPELDRLIGEAAELAKRAPQPRKLKNEPKAEPQFHPEFAAALSGAPKAKAALEGFPPSARRDYLEWIADAKQDATRQKRIATALEWLAEGKRRHWKYEAC